MVTIKGKVTETTDNVTFFVVEVVEQTSPPRSVRMRIPKAWIDEPCNYRLGDMVFCYVTLEQMVEA